MSKALPARPDLEWYRKAAKRKLVELRAGNPRAKLAAGQLAIAREHQFSSWPKLAAAIEEQERAFKVSELRAAIARGHTDDVERMIGRNPDLVRVEHAEGTMLGLAVEHDQADIVKLLLRHGADLTKTYAGSAHSALSWALTVNARKSIQVLLKAGAKPDLFCAAGLGDVAAVRSFFDGSGTAKGGASQTGSTRFGPDGKKLACPPRDAVEVASDALYIASRSGQSEAVAFLLEQRVDLAFRAYLGGTALHWAYFSTARETIDLLVRAGADSAARDEVFGCTPRTFGLVVCASWGIMTKVKRWLRLEPSLVNILDGRGTPLHEAARSGQAGIVRTLLKAGADLRIMNREGKTALELAREGGRMEVVKLLQKVGKR